MIEFELENWQLNSILMRWNDVLLEYFREENPTNSTAPNGNEIEQKCCCCEEMELEIHRVAARRRDNAHAQRRNADSSTSCAARQKVAPPEGQLRLETWLEQQPIDYITNRHRVNILTDPFTFKDLI